MTGRRRYFRARDVAELKGVSIRTVRRRIADGTLPSKKWGGARLVSDSELDAPEGAAPWDVEGAENEEK